MRAWWIQCYKCPWLILSLHHWIPLFDTFCKSSILFSIASNILVLSDWLKSGSSCRAVAFQRIKRAFQQQERTKWFFGLLAYLMQFFTCLQLTRFYMQLHTFPIKNVINALKTLFSKKSPYYLFQTRWSK